jgi:peptidoglycan/xylan/chitin deacetylase (PgdA/CDA1 family)
MGLGPRKSALIRAVDRAGIKWPGEDGRRFGITSILFHGFFGRTETLSRGRDRLRRLCEWMVREYTPITADDYVRAAQTGETLERALFVTFDDAKARILDCVDVFQEFGVPITIFAPCGILGDFDASDDAVVLARAVFLVDRYRGPELPIGLAGGERIVLGDTGRDALIEALLAMAERDPGIARELVSRLDAPRGETAAVPTTCSWRELKDIAGARVAIGSHSMSHCRLAGKSGRRLAFELDGSRRLLQKHFGACDLFAYPYGTWDVVGPETTHSIGEAGYRGAFLVAAGLGRGRNRYTIPRVDIPDAEIDLPVFSSLVRGANVPLTMIKNLLTGRGR